MGVKTVQKEAQTKLEKSQKMVVAAKLTLKDRESEICDKSRKASEVSNKHQTHFWVGMVKEVRAKVATKPVEVDHSDWKNKLCAAVHTMSSAWLVSRPSTSSPKREQQDVTCRTTNIANSVMSCDQQRLQQTNARRGVGVRSRHSFHNEADVPL